MSSILSSSPIVDLWKVDVTELAETEANTPEHQWAVRKGYVSGFVVDATNEDKRVRVVAALKSEHSKLISVGLAEIWEADPKGLSLRWAANNWALDKGFGGGALIGESDGDSCLLAVTEKGAVSTAVIFLDALERPEVQGSCHQYAVTHQESCTAYQVERVDKQDEKQAYCVMLVYRAEFEPDEDDEVQSPAAPA